MPTASSPGHLEVHLHSPVGVYRVFPLQTNELVTVAVISPDDARVSLNRKIQYLSKH